MQQTAAQQIFDRIAIAVSGVCVFHCLVAPFVLIMAPALAWVNDSEGVFHRVLLILILPTSVLALSLGCRRHRDRLTLMLGAGGLLQLGITGLWGHELFGELGERISTVIGSAFLVTSHLRNYRLCRRDECRRCVSHASSSDRTDL
jgi:hypothetical protein